MLQMKLMRKEGARADLSEWEFGTSGELSKALTKEIQDRLDVFFSANGADAILELDLYGRNPEELRMTCEICIEEFETYASAKTTLRELLIDQLEEMEDGNREAVAKALRDLADEAAPNTKASGAGTASAGLPGYAPAHNGERK